MQGAIQQEQHKHTRRTSNIINAKSDPTITNQTKHKQYTKCKNGATRTTKQITQHSQCKKTIQQELT